MDLKKRYEELSPEELHSLRQMYEAMPEEDEPPYPKNGMQEIVREMVRLQELTAIKGRLFSTVRVDQHGDGKSVQIFSTPSHELDHVFGFVLLKAKYKPAKCKGSPCVMDFPFVINFAPTGTDERHVHARALLARGNHFGEVNDFKHEIDDLSEAIRLDPSLVLAWGHRGIARINLKQYDLALADFNKANSLLPTYADAIRGRGIVYFSKGENERAIQELTEAIKLRPGAADVYAERAEAYDRLGRYDLAIADDGEAIRLSPGEAALFNNRCFRRAQANMQLDIALADCNESLRLKPTSQDAIDSRGFVYLRMSQYEDAVRDFDASIKSNAQAYASFYGRAVAKRRLGDLSGSESDIQAARRINRSVDTEFAKFGSPL